MSDPRHEVPQSVQSLPSIGAILIWLSGKPIEWWAGALGIVFLVLQITYLAWKWRRDHRIDQHRQRLEASGQSGFDPVED